MLFNNIKVLLDMLRKTAAILDKKQKKRSGIVFLSMILAAFLEMLSISAIMPFVQAVLSPESLRTNPYLSPVILMFGVQSDEALLILIGGIVIMVYLTKNVALILSDYILVKFTCTLECELSNRMMISYMSRPYTYFLNTNSSEVLRGIETDASGINNILRSFFTIFMGSFTTAIMAGFIVRINPFLAVILLIIAVGCVLLITMGFKSRLKIMGERMRQSNVERLKYAYQAVNGIKEISVMQCRESFSDKFVKANLIKNVTDIEYGVSSKFPTRITEIIFIGTIITATCFGLRYMGNSISFISGLAVLGFASIRILPLISGISSSVNSLVYYRPMLESAYRNIKEAREYEEFLDKFVQPPEAESETKFEFKNQLSIREIYWKYPQSDNYVLRGLSLTIAKGESIALIGESGAGKTTLADVILGLLMPEKGQVEMDGMNVFAYPKQWSRVIGYVPQSVYLLDDTIRNNIAFFGMNSGEHGDEQIWSALDQAQLRAFVQAQPEGLDTIVGERGVKLSGGQRQRIAIARALYYNPEILVLDEATAALDSETETAVMESIEALQGTKTLIIVAHRLTTIRNCDKIFEVKNGEAIQRKKQEIIRDIG